MEMLGIKSNLEILVTWAGIPLYATTHSQLFVRYIEPPIRGMAYQVTCAAVLSRISYDSCICLLHSFQIYIVSMIIELLSSSAEVTMQYS